MRFRACPGARGVRASVSAAWDLRDLLGYDATDLVRGLMLLTPAQRAQLRLALHQADSSSEAEPRESRMSALQNAEAAIEKVFREVEARVGEFDGDALSVARQAIADAKAAEGQVLAVTSSYRNQMVALAEKYGPELAKLGEQMLADVKSLFAVG
jgi:hypothetical protein